MTESGSKLDEESVRSAVESRLRSARLYSDVAASTLSVVVQRRSTSSNFPYVIVVSVNKVMYDLNTGLRGRASSWRAGSFGVGSAEFVRSSLTENIDKFLVVYLRVNEPACN